MLKVRVFRGIWNTYLYTELLLEANVSKVFDKLGVHVEGKDIDACHRLKDNDRTIVKFSNRKDSLPILRVKKDLNSLDPTELDFPESL